MTNDLLTDFPVLEYDGTKAILISTRTVMGGKNPFLGIAYVVVAGVCIVLGVLFTVTHLIKPRYVSCDKFTCTKNTTNRELFRKLGDHSYLSWNTDQAPTAITTGRAMPGDSGA